MENPCYEKSMGVIVYYPDSAELVILKSLIDLPLIIGDSKVNKSTRIEVLPFNVVM